MAIGHKTMRIVLGVTIVGNFPETMSDDQELDLMMRVLNAIVPHPDSAIATDLSGERVTVIATDYELTS